MKRFIVGLATSVAVVVGTAGIALAGAGGPEIDNAAASIQLQPAKFVPTTCVGVNSVNYVTYRGTWKGSETALATNATTYNLTGALTVSNVVWTINLSTDQGVLRGTAKLVSQSPAGGPSSVTYAGPLTLVTQGLPQDTTAAAGASARGWINAHTYTGGKVDGGSLLANVEFEIQPSFAANGEFGASMGFSDYSVAFNNTVC